MWILKSKNLGQLIQNVQNSQVYSRRQKVDPWLPKTGKEIWGKWEFLYEMMKMF